MTWMGASLLGNLNDEINRFSVTRQEFNYYTHVPDRFGMTFMKIHRNDILESEIKDLTAPST